jgi:predicted transposase YdaD
MTVARESEVRMALRHVQTGRRCIMRQLDVIATLRGKGLPTEQAEAVLQWLGEMQREFEQHYRDVLSDGFPQIERGKGVPRLDKQRLTLVENRIKSLRVPPRTSWAIK